MCSMEKTKVYKVGQEGVNTIYKALKCLLSDRYRN